METRALDISIYKDEFSILTMPEIMRSPCPYLPEAPASMNHLCLTRLKKDTPELYFSALQYGHYLWQQRHAGRAILALTRALYADIEAPDPILRKWPLPYAALQWILANHSSDDFPGNPRISFQHQATRLRGHRQDLRRARAWATWALVRQAKPELPGDVVDPATEPTSEEISRLLKRHGHSAEAELWHTVIDAGFKNSYS